MPFRRQYTESPHNERLTSIHQLRSFAIDIYVFILLVNKKGGLSAVNYLAPGMIALSRF